MSPANLDPYSAEVSQSCHQGFDGFLNSLLLFGYRMAERG
jgi:hypothetical protein